MKKERLETKATIFSLAVIISSAASIEMLVSSLLYEGGGLYDNGQAGHIYTGFGVAMLLAAICSGAAAYKAYRDYKKVDKDLQK